MAHHQMMGWRKTSDLLETFALREGPPYSVGYSLHVSSPYNYDWCIMFS